MRPPELSSAPSVPKDADALVLLVPSPVQGSLNSVAKVSTAAAEAISAYLRADASLNASSVRPPVLLSGPALPGHRLIVAALGSLRDETDDVRTIAEQAALAIARAVEAGATRPALWIADVEDSRFVSARAVAALGALGSQWVALEAREAKAAPPTAKRITVIGLSAAEKTRIEAIERGRYLARDITGTEPERMTPARAAELCKQEFADTDVSVAIEKDVSAYPLLSAVARASQQVERHRPRVVRLEYAPKKAKHTLLLVGKGLTYDTGGADLKTNGHMAGMSRDKGGAGAVAGIVRAIADLGLRDVRVVGLLGFVRNSIGSDAFVSDEIIKSRAGVRVRIGNTDAEGRLVLADLLSVAGDLSEKATSPFVMSLATLTGHVYRAHGPYVGGIANARARESNRMPALATLGESWGEPMEWTRPRREDYAFVRGKGPTEDLLSCNRAASVDTPHGHQFPFAFLDIASGLSKRDIPFAHLDIGGVAVSPADWQLGRPTGSPVISVVSYAASLMPAERR